MPAGVGAGEEPILPTQAQGPDGALGGIVGHLQPAVAGEPGQRVPAGGGIADGLGQRALAADPPERRVETGLQLVEERAGAPLADDQTLVRVSAADLLLDREQRGDPLEQLLRDR